MTASDHVLEAIFTTELAILLVLSVFNTYFLTHRPIVQYLREIYFVNSHRFKRAWYLVIAGVTFFLIAHAVRWGQGAGALGGDPDVDLLFELIFGFLTLLAFVQLLLIFRRYIPALGASEAVVRKHLLADLKHAIHDADDRQDLDIDVSIGSDIHRGRPNLGPHVSLSHYRGVTLGITQYLEHRLGELGDTILFAVGRQTGRKAARDIKADLPADIPDLVIQRFLEDMRVAQIGRADIVQQTQNRVSIELGECCVCAGIRGTGDPECHYMSGLFQGLFEALGGGDVATKEVKCCSTGDAFCEFQVDLGRPMASPMAA